MNDEKPDESLKKTAFIPLFVYGTLREKGRFDFYLEECERKACIVANYNLRETAGNDVYIIQAAAEEVPSHVVGEICHVTLACLKRINHLENASGSFPKAYELAVLEGLDEPGYSIHALYYRLKQDKAVRSGDCTKMNVMDFLEKYPDPGKIDDARLIAEIHRYLNGK
jgi:gamma-glutamylcyclotransferase (GGCT)/AIG2-like uncharacterized protein YtfP